jgi:hypothetical protein
VTTIASDVLVLGSTLGGVVAGAYAARAGLRVTLLEEDAHAKRPPILREPFLLAASGLAGPIDRILRELGTGPVERRVLAREVPALQVALRDFRIDLGGSRQSSAKELAGCGLAPRETLDRWLERLEARGDSTRGSYLPGGPAANPRERLWSRLPGGGRMRPLGLPASAPFGLPPPPGGLQELVSAVVEGLSHQAGPDPRLAPALLFRSTLEEAVRGSDTETGVLKLLRERLTSFHGEIRSVPSLTLAGPRGEVRIEVGRERLVARAVVLAAPGRLLQAAVPPGERSPRWLRESPPAFAVPTWLVRVERKALSSGMGMRLVDASQPGRTRWIARTPDAENGELDWLVIRAPSLDAVPDSNPLGALGPFSEGRLALVDVGPGLTWDLGGAEVRVAGAGWKALRSRSPLVLSVGPDVAPALGAEGELLTARRIGIWLAETLPAPRRLPRVSSVR